MSNAEKPAFSKLTLQAAERFQKRLGQAGAPLVSLFTGSKSPVYHQLEWFSTSIDPSSIDTVKAPGDPEAGRLARNWNKAMVMMIGRNALEAVACYHEDGEYAVGYVSQAVLHLGILPPGVIFGYGAVPDTRTAAMRQSRQPIEATMGLWLPQENRLVVPQGLEVVESLVPVTELPYKHHGAPLF